MKPAPDILKELGLSPQWRLCAHGEAAAENNHNAKTQVAKVATASGGKKNAAVARESAVVINKTAAADIGKMDWTALYNTVRQCTQCGLCQKRTQAVFGVGDTEADIMFVGEGPGGEEDRQGEPFVGAAGKLLDKMLAAIELSRDGVYITNVVKCRPPSNRTPKSDEAAACLPYLYRQIALVKPKLIVALGRVAAAHLGADEPIATSRQSMREYNGIRMVVSYHPAYLLRSPADKSKSWEDLRLIKKLVAS